MVAFVVRASSVVGVAGWAAETRQTVEKYEANQITEAESGLRHVSMCTILWHSRDSLHQTCRAFSRIVLGQS